MRSPGPKMQGRFPPFEIQTHRGADGLRQPVEAHVGKKFVLREFPLDVTFAVRPIPKLIDNPSRESHRPSH